MRCSVWTSVMPSTSSGDDMNVTRNLILAAAVVALATPAFAGKDSPTPTPIAPGVVDIGAAAGPTPAQVARAAAAVQALGARQLPASLPAGLKAQAMQALASIQANPALLAQLGLTAAEVAALIDRVNAIPVRG